MTNPAHTMTNPATVVDRMSAAIDVALDTAEMQARMRHLRRLPELPRFAVASARVVRNKPGRRCLLEYELTGTDSSGRPVKLAVLGKIHAKRSTRADYRLQKSFWQAGFRPDEGDGIAVPRPLGYIRDLNMWLQAKVQGIPATEALLEGEPAALGGRMVDAADKIHRSGVPTHRRHAMDDELSVLERRLSDLGNARPELRPRLERVFAASVRLGASVPAVEPIGSHRDFYPDQMIVAGSNLYVIDFDLYCLADPGLDVGNLLGHITEQSLRVLGDADAMRDVERAVEERTVERSGSRDLEAARVYALLTLVRHIYLSSTMPERHHVTEPLLTLCEERLERGLSSGA